MLHAPTRRGPLHVTPPQHNAILRICCSSAPLAGKFKLRHDPNLGQSTPFPLARARVTRILPSAEH